MPITELGYILRAIKRLTPDEVLAHHEARRLDEVRRALGDTVTCDWCGRRAASADMQAVPERVGIVRCSDFGLCLAIIFLNANLKYQTFTGAEPITLNLAALLRHTDG